MLVIAWIISVIYMIFSIGKYQGLNNVTIDKIMGSATSIPTPYCNFQTDFW